MRYLLHGLYNNNDKNNDTLHFMNLLKILEILQTF